jgi:7-keto-8-aminopelargonate synthetase-like enzyme
LVAAAFLERGLTVKDLNPPECPDLLRISLCGFHTDGEIDRLCEAIRTALH